MKNEEKIMSEIGQLKKENSDLKYENEDLKRQLRNFKKLTFGQKSEKTEYIMDGQQSLFNEAENEENCKARAEEKAVIVPAHKRKAKRGHDELAKDLEIEEVLHKVEEAQRSCAECGEEMQSVGKELIRDELVYVSARVFVRRHYAEVLTCKSCAEDESKDTQSSDIKKQVFKKAKAPEAMIPHSFCSPSLLAHIVYEKYVNAMPLYRQEKDLEAKDIKLSRATMANWIIHAAKEWVAPLYEQMREELLKSEVIHADETVVQVLKEPNKKAQSESRMWVYCKGEIGSRDIILFEYQPTRGGDHAKRFLGDFSGYLVTDGYSGYEKLTTVTRCGCWAHLRRKFVEALPENKETAKDSKAADALKLIDVLFALEKKCQTNEEREKIRQEESKPILDSLYSWLDTFTAAGALQKAVGYAKSQKKNLFAFLENPAIPLTNNRIENDIRPFCIGRKNWLFSNSVKGAQSSAMFYSLISTAKANGLNIERYLTELFSTHSNQQDKTSLTLPY